MDFSFDALAHLNPVGPGYREILCLLRLSFHNPSKSWLEMEVELLKKQSHELHTSWSVVHLLQEYHVFLE